MSVETLPIPPVMMDYLVDKAIEAILSGQEVSIRIHASGPDCRSNCEIHARMPTVVQIDS